MTNGSHRPSLTRNGLWETRRTHYLAVFDRALQLLRQHDELPIAERLIIRKLRVTAVTARRELDPHGRFERPIFESQNLPDPDSDRIESHEEKRPDIQWLHDDPVATDDRSREKAFVIECKRLGGKTASGWDLNEQYVISGIARFRSPLWRYGNHMHEGMMVGFVQDMELSSIHEVVNGHLATYDFPLLQLAKAWNESGISQLDHEFERTFPSSPFLIIHRWLDIRDVPKSKPEMPVKCQKKARQKR